MKKIFLMTLCLSILSACGIKTDADIMKVIKAIPQNCDLGDKQGKKYNYGWKIENCKNQELKTAESLIKSKGLAGSIPSLVAAFADKDEKISAVATFFFNRHIGHSYNMKDIAANPALIKDSVAKKFLAAYKERLGEDYTQYATTALTHISMIKGLDSDFIAMVKGLPQNHRKRTSLYANMMKYGRLRVWPTIQELAKTGQERDLYTAVRASSSMRDITEDERAKLCPWLKTHLDADKLYIAGEAAARIAATCRGDYYDLVMNETEKKIKSDKKKASEKYIWAIRYIPCSKYQKNKASDAQCKRAEKLKKKLEKMNKKKG